MSELTLFDLGFDGYIEPMEDGQYVGLSDYIALEAQLTDAKKDAERYLWLRNYLISTDTSHDDFIINASSWPDFDVVIDAARGEGKAS